MERFFGPAGIATPLQIGSLALQDLQWRLGPLSGHAASVALRGVTCTSRPGGLRGVFAESVDVQGVRVTGRLQPHPLPPGPWRLDALQGAEGALQAFVTDAAWIVDAKVTLPVQHGRLSFDQVTVEHIGPDSTMGLSRGGVYVDAPHLGRRYLYLFTAADVPGASYEQRSDAGERIAYRGALDLHAFLAGLLAGASRSLGRPADASLMGALDRTRLAGEVQCGDGLLSGPPGRLLLSGRSVGRNRVAVVSPAAGRELVLRMPALQADECQLDLPEGRLSTGPLRAEAELSLRLGGQRGEGTPPGLAFELRIAQASIQRFTLALPSNAEPDRAAAPVRARFG